MNTGFYRIRWKRGRTFLPVLILLMALFWVQTVFAASTTISAVNITLDLDLKVGEPLPDLNVGYSANSGYEVVIPGNDRYDIDSVKWSSQVDEVTLGGTYTMKIYLDSLNDYSFSGTYSSSKVRVKGGEHLFPCVFFRRTVEGREYEHGDFRSHADAEQGRTSREVQDFEQCTPDYDCRAY